MNAYILWGAVILACFYLGARLTRQTRDKKRSTLHIDFDEAKKDERERRS